jgi:MerC mercury resistance protein
MGTSAHSGHLRPSLDTMGATASFACALHCAVVALMLGLMPAASFLASSWIEWAFLGASTAIGLVALVPGYRKHRLRTPLVLFAVGIALLVALRALSAQASALELTTVLVAALCLILAHWKNRGALHNCACGPKHH